MVAGLHLRSGVSHHHGQFQLLSQRERLENQCLCDHANPPACDCVFGRLSFRTARSGPHGLSQVYRSTIERLLPRIHATLLSSNSAGLRWRRSRASVLAAQSASDSCSNRKILATKAGLSAREPRQKRPRTSLTRLALFIRTLVRHRCATPM